MFADVRTFVALIMGAIPESPLHKKSPIRSEIQAKEFPNSRIMRGTSLPQDNSHYQLVEPAREEGY